MGKEIRKAIFGQLVLEDARPVGDYLLKIMETDLEKFKVIFSQTESFFVIGYQVIFNTEEETRKHLEKATTAMGQALDKFYLANLLNIHEVVQMSHDLLSVFEWAYGIHTELHLPMMNKIYTYRKMGIEIEQSQIEDWENLVGTPFNRADGDEIFLENKSSANV